MTHSPGHSTGSADAQPNGDGAASTRRTPPRWLPAPPVVAQSFPPARASAFALLPSRSVRSGSPVRGSIRLIVASLELATHTEPPPAAIASGLPPIEIVSTTELVVG